VLESLPVQRSAASLQTSHSRHLQHTISSSTVVLYVSMSQSGDAFLKRLGIGKVWEGLSRTENLILDHSISFISPANSPHSTLSHSHL